jgi:hypothetical protein
MVALAHAAGRQHRSQKAIIEDADRWRPASVAAAEFVRPD